MKRMFLFAALAAVSAAGCGHALPPHLADPANNPPPECPKERFLSGVGVSSQDRGDAESRAQEALSKQLGDAISVETEEFSKLVAQNGVLESDRREILRVLHKPAQLSERVGRLVRVSPPVSSGGNLYVVACLEKRAASHAIKTNLASSLREFDSWAEQAERAFGANDRPAFSSAREHAARLVAEMSPELLQLRVLDGGGSGGLDGQVAARWQSIVDHATRMVSKVRFAVHLIPTERVQPYADRLSEVFIEALKGMGREVHLSEQCGSSKEDTYLLEVQADADDCAFGSLGYTCHALIDVGAVECSSGRRVTRAQLPRANLSGMDYHSADAALRNLVKNLEPAVVRKQLRTALAGEIPVD